MVASFDKVKSQEAWYRESLHTCASQNRDDLRIFKKVSVKIAHLMANLMKTNWAYQTSQSSPQMDLIFPPRLDSAVTMFCSTCSCFGQKRSLLNSLGRTQTPSKSCIHKSQQTSEGWTSWHRFNLLSIDFELQIARTKKVDLRSSIFILRKFPDP
jgi:hypothetical protein